MAKGDSGETQNLINQQQGLSQNSINRNTGQTNQLYSGLLGNYQQSLNPNANQGLSPGIGGGTIQPTGARDAQGISSALVPYYQSIGITPGGRGSGASDIAYYADQIAATGGLTPQNAGYWQDRIRNDARGGGSGISSLTGFQNFADTGGFTPQQIQDLRARAIAPTRAIYENAQNDLATQKALTGGYMPNFGAAQARLARQMNYGISDANVNANASIAQAIQQGKLSGLMGLLGSQNMFGNQALAANAQNLQNTGLQNQLASELIQGKLGQSQIPGNFQQAAGNIGTGTNLVGAGANLLNAFMGRSGGSPSGYQQPPSGGNTASANLSSIYNTLSGQGYNNANNGQGLGNVQPGFSTYSGSFPTTGGYGQGMAGVDPNTGLMPGEMPSNPGLGGYGPNNQYPGPVESNIGGGPISQNYDPYSLGQYPGPSDPGLSGEYAGMYTPLNSGPVDNYLGYYDNI